MADQLLFIPFSPWCTKSACGRYSISKNGPDFYRSYSAWYTTAPAESKFKSGELLGVARDGSEAEMRAAAKAMCQKHADKKEREKTHAVD